MAINTTTPLYQQDGDNLLINGGFDVWQRGSSSADATDCTNKFDTVDRWGRTMVQAGMTMPTTFAFAPLNVYGANPFASSTYFGVTYSTVTGAYAPNATSHLCYSQRIERGVSRFASAGATKMIFSAAFYSDVGNTYLGCSLDMNYGTGGSATETITGYIPIKLGWQRISKVFTLNSLTSKTVQADNYLELRIGYMFGSTVNTANYGAPSAVGFPSGGDPVSKYLTNCKLEIGDVATPYRRVEYGQELERCKRYFRKFNPTGNALATVGIGQAVSTVLAVVPIHSPMYKTPSATLKNSLGILQANGISSPVTGLVAGTASTKEVVFLEVSASGGGLAAGNATILRASDSTGDVWLDAEV